MYCVVLHLRITMLTIVATSCSHMACHVIIIGDKVVSCKNQSYFQLTNRLIFIKISVMDDDVDYSCNISLSHGMPCHHSGRLSF